MVAAAGVALLVLGILEPWHILSNRVWNVAQIFGDPDGSETIFLSAATWSWRSLPQPSWAPV